MPDGDAALEGLTSFLARFCKILNPLFSGIRKARDMEKRLYEGRTFLWTFIVGHLARLGSRNAMDANRNDANYADAILELADQNVWPEGERKTAPCTLSCCNFLSRGCTKVLEKALVDIVSHMIRLKLFEGARFCEEYANAVYAMFGGHKELVHKLMDYLAHLHPTFSITGEVKLDYGTKMSATSIAEVLDLPEKLSHDLGDKPIVVAFGEFQEVTELSKEFPLEKIFRSCIQAHRNVRYVFLGSKTHLMKRMFGDATRPFYNSALPMPLRKPPEEESLEFLASRFRDAGIVLPTELAQEILSTSENIPYYLQAIASLAFERTTDNQRTEVLSADVSAAIEDFVGINAELYDERLCGLSDAKRVLIEALAREPIAKFDEDYRQRHRLPVTSTLHTALGELVDAGLVDRAPEQIRLADPLFAHYIRGKVTTVFAS